MSLRNDRSAELVERAKRAATFSGTGAAAPCLAIGAAAVVLLALVGVAIGAYVLEPHVPTLRPTPRRCARSTSRRRKSSR